MIKNVNWCNRWFSMLASVPFAEVTLVVPQDNHSVGEITKELEKHLGERIVATNSCARDIPGKQVPMNYVSMKTQRCITWW